VIAGNEFLKAGTRLLLYPFLLFSYMALHFGFLAAFISLLLTRF